MTQETYGLSSLMMILPSRPALPSKDPTVDLIKQPATAPENYIEPNLVVVEGDPQSASVILIEAAAAVGKTSLANCVGAATGNPVWDLSRLDLGSNTFTGTLLKAYGGNGYDEFKNRLEKGHCCLILDAADEAFAGSGAGHFRSAISDLASLLPNISNRPAVLLTGRFDTITDTALYLLEEQISICRMQVDFFDRVQAEQFFTLKVPNADQLTERVRDFLDSFFSAVQTALGSSDDWDETKDFLGYAPVLDSLVSFFLSESASNPFSVLEGIDREGASYVWDLLFDVVNSILLREQLKFVSAFSRQGADVQRAEAAKQVYGPEQQIELLLADTPMDYDSEVFLGQPPEIQSDLRDALHSFLREHPMLKRNGAIPSGDILYRFSNVAFRDFALATALTTEELVAQVILVNAEAVDARFNPSPMLSRFIFSARLGSTRTIPLESVGLIVDSHSSRVGYEETSLWVGEHVDVDVPAAESGFEKSGLVLELSEGSEIIGAISTALVAGAPEDIVIPLNRSINRCQLNVPGMAVEFGGAVNDFIAGPAVKIVCDRLISNVGVLRIHQQSSLADPVFIQAQKIRGTTRSVNSHPEGLRLIVPTAAYPWTAFMAQASDRAAGQYSWALYAAGMELRKLFSWFNQRSARGGGLRYLIKPMESILAKGRAPRDMFHFCAENGNLEKDNDEYLLRFDFSVPAVTSMNLTDSRLVDFLQSYVEWKRRTGRDLAR